MKRIVVGVDGSPDGQRALDWAAEEARARGADLEVVHVWEYPVAYHGLRPDLERSARQILDAAVSEAEARDVEVHARLVEGRPSALLVREAFGADLLVVGSRGRSGLAAALLGSVSAACVHHAPCPVVVVRPDRLPADELDREGVGAWS